MLRININSMSDMELNEHITAFIEEREKRRENAREKAWKDIEDAIKNYCRYFGIVTICEDGGDIELAIDINDDFSKIGEIKVY